MIESLYTWMKNIIFFMIITTIVRNLLGKSNYKKYAGLVTGLILVLLVIRPILNLLGQADHMNFSIESHEALLEAKGETKDLFSMEEQSNRDIMKSYKKVITNQVEQLLYRQGLHLVTISFVMEEDRQKPEFGAIYQMSVIATYGKEDLNERILDPIQIDPIKVADQNQSLKKESLSPMEIYIKNQLSDFYNIESNNINVTIQEDWNGK